MAFSSRRSREREAVRRPASTDSSAQMFRRSRTLTGSLSQQVRSANEDSSQLRSPRHHITTLRLHRQRVGWLLGGVLLAAAVTGWLCDQLITSPRILFQPASPRADTARYERLVQDYFAERPLQRFYFALNRDEFSAAMVRRAPELSSAVITNEAGLMQYDVLLGARHAVARWQIGDTEYLVDNSGVSYQQSLRDDPVVSVRDETGLPIASQRIVASAKMMTFIGRVVGIIEHTHGAVKEVIIPPGTLKEVDIVLAEVPFRIRLNIDRDPTGQAADVIAALNHLRARGITPRYVDARVEGKAFYTE